LECVLKEPSFGSAYSGYNPLEHGQEDFQPHFRG
jgi:hypothetical protein